MLCGAIGLLLPGLLRIRRELTPLAGIGLIPIMTGATVITLLGGQVGPALLPLAVGLVAALVVYGRRDWLRTSAWVSRRMIHRAPAPDAGDPVRHAA